MDDRLVGRPDGVEEIAGDDDDIGLGLDDLPYGLVEHPGNVNLTLVEAERGLAVVLAIAEVDVGEVSKQHVGNLLEKAGP